MSEIKDRFQIPVDQKDLDKRIGILARMSRKTGDQIYEDLMAIFNSNDWDMYVCFWKLEMDYYSDYERERAKCIEFIKSKLEDFK
jgi:hypothetical protein